jgi:hypothetical protein
MIDEPKAWESYEEVAVYLLNQIAAEFGLQVVEGKQTIVGRKTGTEWEIDAKGISEGDEVVFLVECRRHTTSRLNQESLGGLAYRILDTGAKGGIVVSPLGIQEGAAKVAQAENIFSVILDENSTCTEYVMKFLERVRIGVHLETRISLGMSISATVTRGDGRVEELGEL